MFRMKMILLVAAVTAFAAIAAGCAGKKANPDGSSSPAASNGQPGSSQAANQPETKPPVKITIMANLHTPEVPADKVEKLVEQATNTELEIQWVPDGTYDEKMNASLATGTLPQAVYIKNQSSFILLRNALRSGQFWEIGPFLSEYPNLSKLNPDVLKNTSVDGKIYSLYQERPLSRQGLIYRKDWADKLGLPAPTNVDEFYNMLKAFKERDPDGNNANDTIGLTDRNDLIYGAFKTISSWFGTPNGWGEKDGKLLPEFMFPQYVETMKYIRKLHEEGLINQDFPVTSKTDQQNLLITGKAGAYIGSMADVVSLHEKITEVNPNALLDVQNKISGPDGNFAVWAIPGYGSLVMFPKSAVKTEEELKDILAFFDKLMDPEIANLIYWGVEGEHYAMENGKVVPSEDVQLTDREVKPYQALQIGGISTIEGFYEAKFLLPAKEKAEQLILENNNYLIHDPTTALDSATYTQDGVRLQELIKDATYKFMLGAIDEAGFQSEVDNWLKQGGQKIIDEFNASYAQSK